MSSDLRWAWTLQLSVGPDAAISGSVAARLGGLPVLGHCPVVICPTDAKPRSFGATVLRRQAAHDELDLSAIPGLSLVRPIPALLDMLVVLPWGAASDLLDRALQLHWLEVSDVDALIAPRLGRGRKGATKLRRLHRHASTGSVSPGERTLRPLLRTSRTGRWEPNSTITDRTGRTIAVGDFVLRSHRIVVEVDGRVAHSGREQFERDRVRQNALILEGWLVLRFTYAQVTERPNWVVEQVRAAVVNRELRSETAL